MATMDTQEVITGNRIIAEFVGERIDSFPDKSSEWIVGETGKEIWHNVDSKYWEFHSSWDWLHGAWDKFKTIQLKEWDQGEGTKWNHKFSQYLSFIGTAIIHSTIQDAFNKLVEGIAWYNNALPKQLNKTNE